MSRFLGATKWDIREKVWDYIEANDLANFPRPVHNRIPNFKVGWLRENIVASDKWHVRHVAARTVNEKLVTPTVMCVSKFEVPCAQLSI